MSHPVKNSDLLREIHHSKSSFCYFIDPEHADHRAIAVGLENLPAAVAALGDLPEEGVVVRVMTDDHIPDETDLEALKRRRFNCRAGPTKVRTNFAPFKHYLCRPGDAPLEVGRSHWDGGLHNGRFRLDGGRITDRLAALWMELVRRYAMRLNWRSYSYIEDMRANALVQLMHVGLQFDEHRSQHPNPFAYSTQVVANVFKRVANVERRDRDIKSELRFASGQDRTGWRDAEERAREKFVD